ncbi:iron-containing alcohol dehydrogenase [Tepidibacter sp. Z1-5]|uniref:iron-containing alcohol dehydrogenase n=1 Tax=Tepidibacter sp. Z1-5 TaxID=3134138 RepID=UPI0030C08ADD
MSLLNTIKISVAKPIFKLVHQPKATTYTGPGSVKKLGSIVNSYNLKKVLIVTDSVLLGLGLLDGLKKSLEESNVEYVIYDGVKPDPTFTIVEDGISMIKKQGCDGVIAFGGGSAIDAAKVMSVAYTNQCSPAQLKGMLKVKKKGLPFFAVPTTAGTGSEATLVAVISDPVTHQKVTVIDPKVIPQVAVLDPELTTGLPAHITSTTAMDALTHAIEAFISEYATEETMQYSRVSIKMIYSNLVHSYNNPTDLDARSALLEASYYAGLAFSKAFIGYVHAFSHNIGGAFGIPHGLANAVILPHVIEFSKPNCIDKLAELAILVGLGSKKEKPEVLADKFVQSIFDLNRNLNIPERLDKFKMKDIKKIREAGFKECHGTYPVPRYLTAKQADELLSKVASN